MRSDSRTRGMPKSCHNIDNTIRDPRLLEKTYKKLVIIKWYTFKGMFGALT